MLDSSGAVPGQRCTRWLILALTVSVVGLAACGETPAADSESSTDAAHASEKVVIKTSAELQGVVDTGKVLGGSILGGSPFCPGGTWSGGHGNLGNDWLDKNFKCPDGTLRIAFDPRTSKGRTDSGPWKVLSGTGMFKGLRGSGQMVMVFGPGAMPTEGHETFTGTVVR
jgi:hypothetical protein